MVWFRYLFQWMEIPFGYLKSKWLNCLAKISP